MGGTHTHPQNLSPTEILKYNPGRPAGQLFYSIYLTPAGLKPHARTHAAAARSALRACCALPPAPRPMIEPSPPPPGQPSPGHTERAAQRYASRLPCESVSRSTSFLTLLLLAAMMGAARAACWPARSDCINALMAEIP
jgi:hypothetical protein